MIWRAHSEFGDPKSMERDPLCQKDNIKCHQHPFILEEGGIINCNMNKASSSSSCSDLVCDVCVRPINMSSSPFYRCLSHHFLVHQICANNLPTSVELMAANQGGRNPATFNMAALGNCDHRTKCSLVLYFLAFVVGVHPMVIAITFKMLEGSC